MNSVLWISVQSICTEFCTWMLSNTWNFSTLGVGFVNAQLQESRKSEQSTLDKVFEGNPREKAEQTVKYIVLSKLFLNYYYFTECG